MRGPDPFLVCLSASDDPVFQQAAREAGMDYYCSQKPMPEEELTHTLTMSKILT